MHGFELYELLRNALLRYSEGYLGAPEWIALLSALCTLYMAIQAHRSITSARILRKKMNEPELILYDNINMRPQFIEGQSFLLNRPEDSSINVSTVTSWQYNEFANTCHFHFLNNGAGKAKNIETSFTYNENLCRNIIKNLIKPYENAVYIEPLSVAFTPHTISIDDLGMKNYIGQTEQYRPIIKESTIRWALPRMVIDMLVIDFYARNKKPNTKKWYKVILPECKLNLKYEDIEGNVYHKYYYFYAYCLKRSTNDIIYRVILTEDDIEVSVSLQEFTLK